MPTYDYLCQDCGQVFSVQASMSEYAQGLRPTCPHCGSKKVVRTFSSVNVLSSRNRGMPRWGGCGPMAGPGCCGG